MKGELRMSLTSYEILASSLAEIERIAYSNTTDTDELDVLFEYFNGVLIDLENQL